MIQPRIFKGARDFLPEQMLHRERILEIMRKTFKKYGYAPVETPAIEYLDILTGKYGEEADRLIYKLNYKTGTKDEAALHYDLTVPFSRMVAMNNDLPIPFKRYQMQPVWRADRPQPHQGRFREFYQCDVDCVGAESMLIEAELIAITYEVLSALNIPNFLIKINSRKILNGITQYVGLDDAFVGDVCTSIDKLDKMPWNEVAKELSSKNIPTDSIEKLHALFSNEMSLAQLKITLNDIEIAQKGIQEIEEIFNYLEILEIEKLSLKGKHNLENVMFIGDTDDESVALIHLNDGTKMEIYSSDISGYAEGVETYAEGLIVNSPANSSGKSKGYFGVCGYNILKP